MYNVVQNQNTNCLDILVCSAPQRLYFELQTYFGIQFDMGGKKTHKWTTALPSDHNVVSHYIRVVNSDNKVDHVSE